MAVPETLSPPRSDGAHAFDDLVDSVLVLDPLGDDRFLGGNPAESLGRVYGGQLAAQGLRAAAHTVDVERAVDSLHVCFLGLGDPVQPLIYEVQRLRDSSSFSTRAVSARQGDCLIATMTASFQEGRDGLEHAIAPASGAPNPSTLPRRGAQIAAAFADPPPIGRVPWPIDLRYLDAEPWADTAPASRVWMRGEGALTHDPIVHACVFAYASDLTMFEPVIVGHDGPPYRASWERVSRGEIRGATLDHSIWFHRPFRADDWVLHERESSIAHGSRGLATGRYFTVDGALVASVAQEVALFVEPSTGPDSR